MAQNTTDITATTNVLAITWGHAVYLDMLALFAGVLVPGSPVFTSNTLTTPSLVTNNGDTFTPTYGNFGTAANWQVTGGTNYIFNRDAAGTLTSITGD